MFLLPFACRIPFFRPYGWLLAALLALPGWAQTAPLVSAPLDVAALDAIVAHTLKAFEVPGIAVAVVKDRQVVLSKGYGVNSLKTKAPMDANTLFGIASNIKAFTTAALALLVDEGKLRWDDKVTTYIPEFKMYDPYVMAEFTVRDLLCHRSGLGLGAGDLMQFPDSTNFTTQDIMHNLRYFKPVSSFRSQFDYDNNLYIVAGEVVARLAGQPWAEFVEARLLKPLGMRRSAAGFARLPDPTTVADAHAPRRRPGAGHPALPEPRGRARWWPLQQRDRDEPVGADAAVEVGGARPATYPRHIMGTVEPANHREVGTGPHALQNALRGLRPRLEPERCARL